MVPLNFFVVDSAGFVTWVVCLTRVTEPGVFRSPRSCFIAVFRVVVFFLSLLALKFNES